jgi:flagellar assembly protein FliH
MNSTRFVFDQDFRRSEGAQTRRLAELAEAEQRGLQRGLAEGRAQSEAEIPARLERALQRVAQDAARLLGQMDTQIAQIEQDALTLATVLARKLAGEALNLTPLAPLEETLHEGLRHLRGVPHLVVRLEESLIESAEPRLAGLAREAGFEGRLVVMGEPQMQPGQISLTWADGGIQRDPAALLAQIETFLSSDPVQDHS